MTKDELMDKFCSVFNEATTANDAEDIKISLLAFKKVEQHDGRVECEPYYNKWALYVAMNKAASDQNSVILKWIGDDKDKYIIACYDLALTDLKDKDRPYWIRKYFHVESKF